MNKGNILIGALAGIAAGAILGILIAPDKGAKTRKKLSKKSNDSIEELRSKINEILITANEKLESTHKGLDSIRSIKKVSL